MTQIHALSARDVLSSFGIRSADLEAVAQLGSQPEVDPAALVREFYEWLAGQPWKTQFFGAGVPERVRTAQVQYWREFLMGDVNDAYVASRILVGATHARIGLPPKAYTSAMAFSQQWLFDKARQSQLSAEEISAALAGVSMLCQLDSSLVMDAYADHSNRRVQLEVDKLAAINKELTRVIESASEGSFDERYQLQGDDDALLANVVNQMIDSFRTVVQQAKAIAAGDYSSEVAPRSERDELGRVIAEMTQGLRDATERTRRDQWLKEGQAEIFERMRGELSTGALARAVLTYLAERIGAPVACLYVPIDNGTLELAGTYGRAQEDVRAHIRPGEGILGEVAIQQKARLNLDVSADPVRGFYGLGEVSLPSVAILPLVTDHQLRGILEFALQRPLAGTALEFLEMVSENIAIGLNGARARAQMEALLQQSRKQGDELQTQAEELRASNEELEERSRALQRARQEVESKNRDLERKQRTIEEASQRLEERAQDLATASKYKSEFLANMSHELRTPLNSMLLLTGSLCDNRDGNLNEKQLESLRIVRSGGNDLLRIVDDVLDLSKVEAGKLSVDLRPASLASVVSSLRGQFDPIAKNKNLSLEMEISADAPPAVCTDAQRLEQVLRNLLGNALKFTSEGQVRLRIERAGAGTQCRREDLQAGPVIALAVSDTGIGIPEHKRRAIFEAFQQGDGSTSRNYGGTGLGLTISRQLAALLGGEIQLESEEGKGSTFTLLLPAGQQGQTRVEPASPDTNGLSNGHLSFAQDTPPPPKAEKGSLPTPRREPELLQEECDAQEDGAPVLLVIEDDPRFADIVSEMAREHGYRAVVTASGKQGLLLAQKVRPSGIVLDLGLPDIDGMKALSLLKGNLETRHIPVHVISGHACRPESLELGAMGFLQKPVEVIRVHEMFDRFRKLWSRNHSRILVVEDDPATQAAIHDLLDAEGVTIVLAETGKAGLSALSEGDFDCMVVDLGLPDMRGSEFLKQLDETHPPVIVYTAQDLSDEGMRELSQYTSNVVIKDARTPERLLDEVSLFLHQVEANMTASQQATLQKIHQRKRELTGRKVLIADDDMRNMYALTELLQRQGIEVLQAKNGRIALEKLNGTPDVDLVIMDIMMPVMDGLEAIQRIRAESRFSELPVIAVTAKTLPEDRQACLSAGASDYIAKPMDPENLLALMRVLLFDSRPAVEALTFSKQPSTGEALRAPR